MRLQFFQSKMTTEEKSIQRCSFWAKRVSKNAGQRSFCLKEREVFKKPLVRVGSTVKVDIVPMQSEYEEALESDTDLDKIVVQLGELNEITCKNLILSIKPVSLWERWHSVS